jgi:hypothetical protein
LHETYKIPPGTRAVVAIVSTDQKEAGRRIHTVRAILDALEEPYTQANGGLALTKRPIIFEVQTATIAGVSGFTAAFVFCDEVAKWRDAKTGANPATEVLASIAPTMVTQPRARIVLCSSPMGELDAHAAAVRDGNGPGQMVAIADSFTAHPGLDEAQTHLDIPDTARWRREYMAVPMEGDEESLYYPVQLDRATRAAPGDVAPVWGWSYVAAMDHADRGNAWTLVIATRHNGRRIVVATREWQGSRDRPLIADDVFQEMIGTEEEPGPARVYRIRHIACDDHGGPELARIARRYDLNLMQRNLTQGDKIDLYEALGTYLADGIVELPPERKLRADLLGVRRKLTANGMSIELDRTPDGRHSDLAVSAALALCSHCAEPRAMPQGPAEQVMADDLARDMKKYRERKVVDFRAPLPALLRRR